MGGIAYTVTATLPDEDIARRYIDWLKDGHVDQVIEHGAKSGIIVRLEQVDGDRAIRVETRYVFPTRKLFERYLEEFAPGLRADGLKHFPPETGIRFERRIGDIV